MKKFVFALLLSLGLIATTLSALAMPPFSASRWTTVSFEELMALANSGDIVGLRVQFEQVDADGQLKYDGKYDGVVTAKPDYYAQEQLFSIPLLLKDGSQLAFEFSPDWPARGILFLRKIKVRIAR